MLQFNGWENISAFKHHISFIKSHYRSIGHGAIVIWHFWQKIFIAIMKMIFRKDIKIFQAQDFQKASEWLIR